MNSEHDDRRHVGQLAHHKLRVWHEVRALNRLVHANRIADAELRDQAGRAVRSAGLNTCEGAARDGKMKTNHYKIAHGSTIEVVGCYELASDHGVRGEIRVGLGTGLHARVERVNEVALGMLQRPRRMTSEPGLEDRLEDLRDAALDRERGVDPHHAAERLHDRHGAMEPTVPSAIDRLATLRASLL